MDGIFRRIRHDELLDKFIQHEMLPIREFAELMDMAPQLIYYRLRNHKLTRGVCERCGTDGFIDLKEACGEFPSLKEAVEAEKETQGGVLET